MVRCIKVATSIITTSLPSLSHLIFIFICLSCERVPRICFQDLRTARFLTSHVEFSLCCVTVGQGSILVSPYVHYYSLQPTLYSRDSAFATRARDCTPFQVLLPWWCGASSPVPGCKFLHGKAAGANRAQPKTFAYSYFPLPRPSTWNGVQSLALVAKSLS